MLQLALPYVVSLAPYTSVIDDLCRLGCLEWLTFFVWKAKHLLFSSMSWAAISAAMLETASLLFLCRALTFLTSTLTLSVLSDYSTDKGCSYRFLETTLCVGEMTEVLFSLLALSRFFSFERFRSLSACLRLFSICLCSYIMILASLDRPIE